MVISRVISRGTILISHIMGLITLLITTPEPPSSKRDISHLQTGSWQPLSGHDLLA